MDIASTLGGLTPLIVVFGILSRIVVINFNGIKKLLIFIALTVIPTIYVYIDITNNISIPLIFMVILAIISIFIRITKKKS